MATRLRTAMDVATGRYWWVLAVHDRPGEERARVLRVLRGRGTGHARVDISFAGSLEECRRFQAVNGGSADGTLLVDDVTPVKAVPTEDGEFNRDSFECARPVEGGYAIVALRRAVEELADETTKAGFRILAHIPVLIPETETLRSRDLSGARLFTCTGDGVTRAWYFENGEFLWACKVLSESAPGNAIADFVGSRFLQKKLQAEDFGLDTAEIAKAVAEDAWLFRTDRQPAFSTKPDSGAVTRIREASLFRKTSKACAGILFASLLATLAFRGGVARYLSRTETQLAAIERNVEARKELERLREKMDAEMDGTVEFLGHRSRMSSFMGTVVADLPANSWITHWSINRNTHSLQGYAVSPEDVSGFLSTLEKEKSLVNVRLRTTEKTTFRRKPVVKFDLTAEVVQ